MTPLITGTRGALTFKSATTSRICSATGARMGEWNACETSSAVTFTPRSSSASEARFTASVGPEMTVCFG